jgi:WD40 repeat-containing protein SMU1
MREVATVELSDTVQADLFEQILLEMVDQREIDTCRKLFKTRPLRLLQANYSERFGRLDGIFHRGQVEEHEWPMGSKKKNRKVLSKMVLAELATVPPSRLLTIVGQALKWQRHMGHLPPSMAFSLFRDRAPEPSRAEEQPPTLGLAPIVFAKGCRPICAQFSPDGRSLATGSSDGFVEGFYLVVLSFRNLY